jgi:uncharacterized protein YhjY with autotransporter beta-barrel domain
MRIIKSIALSLICAVGLLPVTTYAQINPNNPLVIFVNNTPGATMLQQHVGYAIADVCPNLGGFGQPDGPQRDLFLRCNEMIATACELNGLTDPATGEPLPCPGRSLGLSNPEDLLAAIQQVWGEELHSNSSLTTRVTNGQFSNIAGRMNALRLGGASGAIGGRVASVAPDTDTDRGSPGYGMVSLDSRSSMTGGGAAADVAGSRIGWFLEGSFNTGDRDQTANEDGFDFDSTSFTLGLDYLFDSGVIGISAGIDTYEADFFSGLFVTGGDVEVEGTSGSIFGAWFGENFYVDGLVTIGNLDNDMSRSLVYSSTDTCVPPDECPAQDRTLTGETDGDYVAAGATLGYEVVRGNWDITTSLSVAYRDIDIDGFDEIDTSGGGMGLRYSDQTIESLRSILGIAFTGNFSRSFGILSPHFRVEWHHEFEDDPIWLSAKYIMEDNLGTVPPGDFTGTACLSCAMWNSDEIDTDFALVGIGLSAVFSRRIQIYGMYDALLGLDNLTSNTFSVGMRGQF